MDQDFIIYCLFYNGEPYGTRIGRPTYFKEQSVRQVRSLESGYIARSEYKGSWRKLTKEEQEALIDEVKSRFEIKIFKEVSQA